MADIPYSSNFENSDFLDGFLRLALSHGALNGGAISA
jgi:hypothetical protein